MVHTVAHKVVLIHIVSNEWIRIYGYLSVIEMSGICLSHKKWSKCTVYCYGNGCHGLNLTCIDGNGTCTLTIDCQYAEYDEYMCPNGYKLSPFMNDDYVPDLFNISANYND